ncbi:MAG: 2-succinyl-5-enolpyruvyl-6-hydroxy-3-cyclohexene-1-carboxylic-acid synthase [Actinomycetota bacterium]|nr:2-succinyl-5-enolpyruvyl-6-hydroxy-3-cyclohexene-1-carboxylic-acid synthase [Actinomycetota bacterium]
MTAQSAGELARAVVAELIVAGVGHVVLCPGSRNAPLAFAVYDAALAGRLTLHSRIDERTAGFVALGIAKAGRQPAAVVTTSGTAVANLHPAVLEASHAGVPLLAVTADRPAALRGTGANQTTDQAGIFGDAVPFLDLASVDDRDRARELLTRLDGPVHLNVQLDDPLVPGRLGHESSAGPARVGARVARSRPGKPTTIELGPRTVVVAGDDAGPDARILAEHSAWPLLAEPTSGARTGANPIRTYRLLLDTELGGRIERVVVYGHPTLSRAVSGLLSRSEVEVISVRARGRWSTRPHPVTAEHAAVVAEADDPAWLEEWRAADGRLSRRVDAVLAAQTALTPYDVAAAVSAALPAAGLLFVGASNPIRDLDLMARAYPVGEHRLVLANRGLSGIDGTISSAVGAAMGRPSSRSIALLGDVTLLHDSTGLVIGPDEQRPDLSIVVVNDDGGSIFSVLEQGRPAYSTAYEKLFGTPHGVDLAALCAATRTPHWRVASRAELEHALASPNGGIEVVEAVCRRDNRRTLDAELRAQA